MPPKYFISYNLMIAVYHSVPTFRLTSQFSLTVTCPPFYLICDTTERWSSDKVNENYKANLKVYCVMQLLLNYKVFRWHPLNIML